MSNQPCISGINLTWSWCIILFIHFWVQFADILLSIFVSMSMRGNGPQFSCVFLRLWYQASVGLRKRCKKYSLYTLLEETAENMLNFLLKSLVKFTSELILAWCFLLGSYYQFNFFTRCRLSISFCVTGDKLRLSRNWSISPRLPSLWAQHGSQYSSITSFPRIPQGSY